MKTALLSIFIFSFGPLLWARTSFMPKSFKAEFYQIHKSSLTKKERKTKGRIDYKFPGHIRFETTSPDNIIYVSNPAKTWYYTAPFLDDMPGELTISETNKDPLVKFFDLLSKGLKSNKMYSVKKMKTGSLITFSKENQIDMGVRSALLKFKKKRLFNNIEEVLLTKTDKSILKLIFKKIDPNFSFKENYFIFKVPENTRVIH